MRAYEIELNKRNLQLEQRIAELEGEVRGGQLRFAGFAVSVAMLFEKLEKEADDHPLLLAEISQERCRDFAANARAALAPEGS